MFLKDSLYLYTRVSHFLPWVNATIMSNGGLDSCNFSVIVPPSHGNSFHCDEKDNLFLKPSPIHLSIQLLDTEELPTGTSALAATVVHRARGIVTMMTSAPRLVGS